ncbi:MAG: hypothetical protein IJ642_07295 [Oscillospiraceae bacterium]|nr:hypothetical protein [Oscillospiraceae bacterium]
MKKIFSVLTASVMFSGMLTGCGTRQETESVENTVPDIQIATIQVETQTTQEEEIIPPSAVSTEAVQQQLPAQMTTENPKKTLNYQTELFDKAVFGALLSGLSEYPIDFIASDADRDSSLELLVALPVSETFSQNIVFENINSSGMYYYDATGVTNDFYVMDPANGNIYLNENTRTDDGAAIISQEYFEWTGSSWRSACMLYSNNCYWNYENVTVGEFEAYAASMQKIYLEDLFNLTVSGTPETAAEAFYQYLAKWFKPERPVSADIDGDGTPEYYVSVQNLSKPWYSNVRNLYSQETTLIADSVMNMHTTCFVFDFVEGGKVRIRSENFDRRYRFNQSGGKLFAYDDTNTIQTVQYSNEPDGFGTHIMSVSMMMG